MPSPSPDDRPSPEDQQTDTPMPITLATKEVQLFPTTIKVQLPTSVFQLSAWGNVALNHFEFDSSGFELINKAEGQYPALMELGQHFYEVIHRSINQLKNADRKEWIRFLLAGPDIAREQADQKNIPINPVELAYANLLFSASCLCRADAIEDRSSNHYKLWREAGFITSAQFIKELNQATTYDTLVGPRPIIQLKEKLQILTQKNPGSPRLMFAINDLIESFDTTNEYLDKVKKEYGILGDRLFALSTEAIGENQILTRQNYRNLRKLTESIKEHVSQDTWCNADDYVRKLLSPEGGHLVCVPDNIYPNESLRKAVLGMIREVNQEAQHIILAGSRWVDCLLPFDPKKRSAEDLIAAIHYWFKEKDPSLTLQSFLQMPSGRIQIDNIYSFFKQLKGNHFNSKATLQLSIDPDLKNNFEPGTKVVIVGANTWESYFLNTKYVSVAVSNTKSESHLDLSVPLIADSGIRYFKAAAYAVANDYGSGAWKSCYFSGDNLMQVISSMKWEEPKDLFNQWIRAQQLSKEQLAAEKYHNHYILIHDRDQDRNRPKKVRPSKKLVLT